MPVVPPSESPEATISNLESALLACSARLGQVHPETIALANQLADAYWRSGRVDQAVGVLDQALSELDSSETEASSRAEILCTLGQILLDQGCWNQAAQVLRELLNICMARCGACHPGSLSVQGDLAEVLFELGEDTEALAIEAEAFENAQIHLGRNHPVFSVLAWNRVVRHERSGEAESARAVLLNELTWLIAESDENLDSDQQTIKALLIQRFRWDTASAC